MVVARVMPAAWLWWRTEGKAGDNAGDKAGGHGRAYRSRRCRQASAEISRAEPRQHVLVTFSAPGRLLGGRCVGTAMLSRVLRPGSGFVAGQGWVWGARRALGHFAPKWSQVCIAFLELCWFVLSRRPRHSQGMLNTGDSWGTSAPLGRNKKWKSIVFFIISPPQKRPLVGSWHTKGVLKAGHGLTEAAVVVGTSSLQKRAWVEGKGQMWCLSGCDSSHSCAA